MLPKSLRTALWSYDIKKMTRQRDKNTIITQILNHGTWPQVQWLLKNYSPTEIKEVIKHPSRGVWRADALNYWEKIFNLRLPKNITDKALFTPYAK